MTERGRRRFERWLDEAFSGDRVAFERHLARVGITEADLVLLLGEEGPPKLEGASPAWWRSQRVMLGASECSSASRRHEPTEQLNVAFALAPMRALVSDAIRRLEVLANELAACSMAPPGSVSLVPRLFLPLLEERLHRLAHRAVLVELNERRHHGRLSADTPEGRFQEFIAQIATPPGLVEFFDRYPVLAHRAMAVVEAWMLQVLDFLQCFTVDQGALTDMFPETSGSEIIAVRAFGDSHRSGRCVLLVRFENQSEVVFKPRPLTSEQRFQELLAWLNERGLDPQLRPLRVLDRGTHGWMEAVTAAPCERHDEVRRFFRRQGSQLAIVYSLCGVDLHHENLVAAGEHPFLVDSECLFHPSAEAFRDDLHAAAMDLPYSETVFATGLLPQRIWAFEDGEGVDVSGLGARAGSAAPTPVAHLTAAGTDSARLEEKPAPWPDPESAPRLAGSEVPLRPHLDDLLDGFRDAYRLLRRCRAELLETNGPLARFADVPVRVVVRPTNTYARLLEAACHPYYLTDPLDRQRLFDRLWSLNRWRKCLHRLFEHEQRDLERGDVPLFTTRPESRDLWSSDGSVVSEFLRQSGLEHATRRLHRLDEDDLSAQVRLIRGAVETASPGHEGSPGSPFVWSLAPAPTRHRLLEAAKAVGTRLGELAVWVDKYCYWYAPQLVGSGRAWSYEFVGSSLYSGQAGIALFLAHLAAITGDDHFQRLARAAVEPVARSLEAVPRSIASIGAMTGSGGLILAGIHLAHLWGEDRWLQMAEAAAEHAAAGLANDTSLDLLNGAAGAALALLRLAEVTGGDLARKTALGCAQHLVANAREAGPGLGWISASGLPPLAGLSHGAAGIAWALAEVAALEGDIRAADAASAARLYENSLFDGRNWRDLRPADRAEAWSHRDGSTEASCTWCHGAAGIGLGRLMALPSLGAAERQEAERDLEAATEATLSRTTWGSHSLCHGATGNLLILDSIAHTRGDRSLERDVRSFVGSLLEDIDSNGWRCHRDRPLEIPGLMTGIAGIGYGFLRLADRERVPNLLALEVPRK